MSMATERCGRCGAALVSMEIDPDAIHGLRCRRCAEADERRRARVMTAMIVCTTVVVAFSAWQMLVA